MTDALHIPRGAPTLATFAGTAQQSAELSVMRHMLETSHGTFSLSIAECNSPALRDYLLSRLRESFPGAAVVSIPIGTSDPFGSITSNVGEMQPSALFITDLERVVHSGAIDQPGLRSLNAARELLESRFPCPVILWLPEYACVLLSIHARDVWRYRSHRFRFVSVDATAAVGVSDTFAGTVDARSDLPRDEKRFRIAVLEQRVADAEKASDPALRIHVLRWLGELAVLYFGLGRYSDAERRFREVEELATRSGNMEDVAAAVGNLGVILLHRGDLCAAEAMHLRSLEIEEKLGRLEGVATAYSNLGIIARIRGDLDGAEAMHRRSLEIEQNLGRIDGIASDYGNLGIIMQLRGNLREAEEWYRKALEIEEGQGRLASAANNYVNLGNIMQLRGDLVAAEAMHRKALDINERLGRLEGMADAYAGLGNALQSRGELNAAEAMHCKSLEIEESLGRLEGIANEYGNLGIVMKSRGDLRTARELLTKSRDLFAKLGAKQMVDVTERRIDELAD